MAITNPSEADTIVDVGANAVEYLAGDNYLEKHYAYPENITVVCLDDIAGLQALYPKVKVVRANGTKLPFPDQDFGIAYSNAVIEHVGDEAAQVAFLRELARVGKRGFITTPNRYFPIETHTRVPLLHLILPKAWFDAFLRFIGQGWAAGDYMRLLSKKDLVHLLKQAGIADYRVTCNRIFGLTLTYTVTWQRD